MELKKVKVKPIELPIEFKTVEPSDFEDYIIEGNKKTIISPDENGYLGNRLIQSIDLGKTDTVVINAGVGQGKSTECINIALHYLNELDENGDSEYVVIFIAPSKNLVNQYQRRLIQKGVISSQIFNYASFDKSEFVLDLDSVSKLPIHILSINALIGNPGVGNLLQKSTKSQYLSALIKFCEVNNKKVIFVFDEIHESIHNFKEKFIFNLWKWYKVLHKNFILSATYSESSKVVIKYLAELTDDKIQIVESERIKIEERQSKLHICLNNNFTYSGNDEKIAYLIEQECNKNKLVHILTFSETLASSIAEPIKESNGNLAYSKVGKLLIEKFGKINLCTSKTSNSFDETSCNVGTTFKTGISIDNEDTSFFIITPSYSRYQSLDKNSFGIFSDGAISVIQAVARIRNGNGNNIFVVMPSPKSLIKNSQYNKGDNYLLFTTSVRDFRLLNKKNKFVDYYSLNSQSELLNGFYENAICGFVDLGIENFKSKYTHKNRSIKKPRLEFTTKDLFILEEGDKYFNYNYEIFGSDISAYIIWAAFNNQFENTTLSSVYFEDKIILKEGRIIQGLFDIFYNRYGIPYNWDFIAEKHLYNDFYDYVTSVLNVSIITREKKLISAKNSTDVKIGIITVLQYLKRNNIVFNKSVYPDGAISRYGSSRIAREIFIDKEMYIRAAMSNSIKVDSSMSNEDNEIVESYKRLYSISVAMKDSIIFNDRNGKSYIPTKSYFRSNHTISNEMIIELFAAIKIIRNRDLFIKDNTFSFCQWADKIKLNKLQQSEQLQNEVIASLIEEIRDLFFIAKDRANTTRRTLTNKLGHLYSSESKPYYITNEFEIRNLDAINLVYASQTPYKDSDSAGYIRIALGEEMEIEFI